MDAAGEHLDDVSRVKLGKADAPAVDKHAVGAFHILRRVGAVLAAYLHMVHGDERQRQANVVVSSAAERHHPVIGQRKGLLRHAGRDRRAQPRLAVIRERDRAVAGHGIERAKGRLGKNGEDLSPAAEGQRRGGQALDGDIILLARADAVDGALRKGHVIGTVFKDKRGSQLHRQTPFETAFPSNHLTEERSIVNNSKCPDTTSTMIRAAVGSLRRSKKHSRHSSALAYASTAAQGIFKGALRDSRAV